MKFTHREGDEPTSIARPAGFTTTVIFFGGAALLLFTATRVMVPAVVTATGIEPILAWFIAAGFFVFVPLIVSAMLVLRSEKLPRNSSIIRDRLRFQRMTSMDWIWSFVGFGIIGALGFVIAETLRRYWPIDMSCKRASRVFQPTPTAYTRNCPNSSEPPMRMFENNPTTEHALYLTLFITCGGGL